MHDVIYRRARKRVTNKKRFYRHLSVYIAVGLFFFIMNMVTLGDDPELWFFFPLLPWGVAILIHYFSVFGMPFTGALTSEWEAKELQKEMDRLESLALPAAYEDRKEERRKDRRRSRKRHAEEEELEELELRQLEQLPDEGWRKEDLV